MSTTSIHLPGEEVCINRQRNSEVKAGTLPSGDLEEKRNNAEQLHQIVRRSPPRHSPPQTLTTSDVHHPLCKIRRSPPQTFINSDVHHLRRSPPQTFTTPDVHHPQCKIRRSPPQTFTTPDVHHPRRSPPPV